MISFDIFIIESEKLKKNKENEIISKTFLKRLVYALQFLVFDAHVVVYVLGIIRFS